MSSIGAQWSEGRRAQGHGLLGGEGIRSRGGEGWPVATVDPASHRKGLGEPASIRKDKRAKGKLRYAGVQRFSVYQFRGVGNGMGGQTHGLQTTEQETEGQREQVQGYVCT